MIRGVDLSYANGAVNWRLLSGAVDFAVIRAGYGRGTPDAQLEANLAGAAETGVHLGAYWFSYAYTPQMAQNEADALLRLLGTGRTPLFVAFDWEDDSRAFAVKNGVTPTPQLVRSMADAFLERIRQAGLRPVLYTNPSYMSQYFTGTTWPIWIAQWPRTSPWQFPNGPPKSSYQGAHIAWQFGTWDGVPGVSGVVDANYFYGEVEDLTEAQVRKLFEQLWLEKLADSSPVPDSLAAEFAQAQAAGITDGSRPNAPCTRAQAAVMALRAKK